jgi:hypothetical protein
MTANPVRAAGAAVAIREAEVAAEAPGVAASDLVVFPNVGALRSGAGCAASLQSYTTPDAHLRDVGAVLHRHLIGGSLDPGVGARTTDGAAQVPPAPW